MIDFFILKSIKNCFIFNFVKLKINLTIEDIKKCGVNTRIVEVVQPTVCWSLTKNRVVNGYSDVYEIVNSFDGLKLSIENNRLVTVNNYKELDYNLVKEINKSNGIIFYPDENFYRIGFIPKNEHIDFI